MPQMKTAFNILAVAIFLTVTPNPCFAVWDIEIVSKERAKELGLDVRPGQAGPTHVRVELEFKIEGELKNFSGVDLRIGQGNNPPVTAPLREDRSKPGHVVVRFTAEWAQLEKLTLEVMVPGTLGGTVYDLRVKDFVEMNIVDRGGQARIEKLEEEIADLRQEGSELKDAIKELTELLKKKP